MPDEEKKRLLDMGDLSRNNDGRVCPSIIPLCNGSPRRVGERSGAPADSAGKCAGYSSGEDVPCLSGRDRSTGISKSSKRGNAEE